MAKSNLAARLAPVVRILLVEDNSGDAFLIGELLGGVRENEYEIHHVQSQAHAIAALSGKSFEVCLLDLSLPDVTGFSALIEIQEKAPDMPVLILTGFNDTALAKQAVGQGAQDYLLKDELETSLLSRSIEYARERKYISRELFHRAYSDPLTGLANSNQFDSRLQMALARSARTRSALAVLYLDLDRFKAINDTYGHEAGNTLLKTFASRIKGVLRSYDIAARLGGDEFAILLENIASPRNAAVIAQKIVDALVPSVTYKGKKLAIATSIGIAFCDSPETAGEVLQKADAAMYHAKNLGGNLYRFYAPEMQKLAEERLKAEEEIRAALTAEQFRLYYQPCVLPSDSALMGVEVLLRWAHPERGLLSPDSFLGLAEECGLMPDIARWMFSVLAKDLADLNEQPLPSLEIAFNVAASQLDTADFSGWIAPLAREAARGKHRLVAEIDCSALEAPSEGRFLAFVQLREMGVQLHLDHFEESRISLQTLHTYPFSLLKLNLVSLERMNRGGQGDAMIHTAIGLAHQLGMKAGAVGVETARQMHMLQEQRCDRAQGYLISRPMTAGQLPKWIAEEC